MVCSLDGFIAKPNGDVSWLETKNQYSKGEVLSENEIHEFLESIDCYIMGSKTYEHTLELGWPYGDKPTIVLTSRILQDNQHNVTFYNGDIGDFLESLTDSYQNIWLVGGSKLAKDFLLENLVDEIVISILPILLGDGLLFFDYIGKEIKLHLLDHKAYKDGLVELSYQIKK